MAIYLARLRSPFFIEETSTATTVGSADLTITIGSTDVYIISKDTVSKKVTLEVAELIRDYLDPVWDGVVPYSSAVIASQTVTATLKVEFYANNKATRAANSLAGNTDTPISGQTVTHTLHGFDAYSEFLEGHNHQITDGQLMQSATIMYLPETGSAYIPHEDSTANTNAVAYHEVADSVADGTQVTVGGIGILIKRICEPVFEIVKVVFMNKFGALQEFHFNKKHMLTLGTTQENYESMLMGSQLNYISNNLPHQKYVYNKQGKETLVLNTGYVDDGQFETIKQIMLSEQVWAKIGTTVYPVNVNTSSLAKKTKINDRLVNYQLEFMFAFDVVNNVR